MMVPKGEIVNGSRKPPKDQDDAILFEHTLCLFLGNKAAHTAGQANHPMHRRYWLTKVCRLILKRIETLNTTPRRMQSLLTTARYASTQLSTATQPTWRLVFQLLMLIGKLLGYGNQRQTLFDLVSSWQ